MFLLLLEGMCFRIMVIRFGAHVFQFPFTFIAIISAFEILMTWYSFISFDFSLIDYGTKIRIFLSLASSFYNILKLNEIILSKMFFNSMVFDMFTSVLLQQLFLAKIVFILFHFQKVFELLGKHVLTIHKSLPKNDR